MTKMAQRQAPRSRLWSTRLVAALALAAILLSMTASASTSPSPPPQKADTSAAADGSASSASDPLAVPPGDARLHRQSPQQAYDRALSLLRSTIKSKPKATKPPPAAGRNSPPANGKDAASQQDSASPKSPPAPPSGPRFSIWDLILGWTPLGTIYRLFLFVAEAIGLRSARTGVSADAALSLPVRSGLSSADPNAKWLGPPIGATRDELRWQGARPLPLWPDWEWLGQGQVPLNSEDSAWDSVMFGPFHAGWDGDEADSDPSSASQFLQDVSVESSGGHRAASRPLWQHPAIPAAIRRRFEAKRPSGRDGSGSSKGGLGWLPSVEAPWSQAKRQRREQTRLQMEQRRAEALELLEWAAWGRTDIDWEYEAYERDSTADILANLFDLGDSKSTQQPSGAAPSNVTRIQAHADALWVLAEHSLWGTHGATPNIARARACYQRLVDFGQDAAGFSRAGNASAHARLAFLDGSGWESTVRRQWTPPSTAELDALHSSRDEDEIRSVWQRRRDAFADLKRDDGLRQAKAMLHYTQAAKAGDAPSQMALGFRYRAGIGTRPDCNMALAYYENAAQDAYVRFQAGPPGGLTVPYSKLRLSDLAGGAYGPGASVASTGLAARKPAVQAALNRQPGTASDPHGLEDMLEYHVYHAERGDARFMLMLARVYYQGSIWAPSDAAGAVRRDYKKAMAYLLRITRRVWPKDAALVGRGGPSGWLAKKGDKGEDVQLKVDDQRLLVQAGQAASLVGRMYLRGEGVRQDFARAWVWFNRGADTGDGEAYNGLGVMLRDGHGVQVDVDQATQYFEAAAKERSLEGTINLAKVHIELEDYATAIKSLDLAVRASNSFEAYYLLASINAKLARSQSSNERCRLAVAGFKQAVERGDWATPIFHKAERAWRRGKKHKALLGWALAGELGYEAAQNNVAYILDRDKRRLHLPLLDGGGDGASGGSLNHYHLGTGAGGGGPDNSTDRLALIHWTRSAGQDNVDAMVKMGDYYFHGIGTRNPGRAAYDKAAACYSAAADRQVSALAYWNMGWLYESGLGVARRDFHLAKRYYDMAVEVNEEAYLPVLLSLIKLHLRALWAAVWRADADASDSALSLFSSYTHPADTGDAAYTEADEVAHRNRRRMEEEARGRHAAGEGAAAGDGDVEAGEMDEDEIAAVVGQEQGDGLGDPNEPETWYSGNRPRRRGAGAGRFDDELPHDDDDEYDDVEDLLEGGLLVVALGVLAYLAYVRQGVQMRMQRDRRGPVAAPAAPPPGGREQHLRGENHGDDNDDDDGGQRDRRPFPWEPEGGGARVAAGL